MGETGFGSAPASQDAQRYSYWRVWIDGDEVRVARDDYRSTFIGPRLRPQHLTYDRDGRIVWKCHRQGGRIAAVELRDFIAWLDQRGHETAPAVLDQSDPWKRKAAPEGGSRVRREAS